MQSRQGNLYLAATDLANHLACGALTALDAAVARGERGAPRRFDARLNLLRERGREHERGYLGWLRSQGLAVLDLGGLSAGAALAATRRAMADGIAVIAQAALADGVWFGRPDVLRRVEVPSRLGAWSYEPYDTKLEHETSGATVLQLCVYADLLARAQGRSPAGMHVVAPGGEAAPDSLRVDEFLAFYRQARQSLEWSVAQVAQNVDASPAAAPYPRPVEHCEVCRWWSECDRRWHDDDHLSLVAGLGRGQEREIRAWGVETVRDFAALPLPLDRRPARGSLATFAALHGQAAAQIASRGLERPFWARLDVVAGQGLCRLPEPSPGDVFLDLEGDRFWSEGGGLEYLFGTLTVEDDGEQGYRYQGRWATGRREERQAFESLVDELMERWERHPTLHVFHYGSYDAATLKRLAARHGTREEALDRLLRGERFVDLLRVVRQGLRVGVESYSLKRLEPCYGFVRQLPLETARAALLAVDTALAERQPDDLTAEIRAAVTSYNREDCLSTLRLRTWLEERRSEAIAAGAAIPRPTPPPDAPSETLNERQERIRALAGRLLDQVPVEPAERTPEQHARFLLAHCLEFHRREDKVGWWEFFSRIDLSEQERVDEPRAIAGLEHECRLPLVGKARVPTDRYRFTPQEIDARYKDAWLDKTQQLGTIESLDVVSGQAEIKKTTKTIGQHPTSVVLHRTFKKNEQVGALERLALWVAEYGLDSPADEHRAARDLLLRRRPRPRAGEPAGDLRRPEEPVVDAARRLGLDLEDGVLPIQGPPGAGKTYAGARMIVELVKAGRRVGVTATSHKVIQLLLSEAMKAATDESVALRSIRKVGEGETPEDRGTRLETNDNGRVAAALRNGEAQVAAGTSWLWSRAELAGAVDVLFVDEAGQMSLADVLAVSQAARGLVLLGDPSQLEQPIQGSHPDGTDVAALDHILGEHETLPADRGLFLDQTWRLHPAICAFTSEQFYEGRLASLPGLERQALHAPPAFEGSGLWFLPVDHQGNTNFAAEEVDAIAALVEGWFDDGAEWTDRHGVRSPLGAQDVLIVAPYNAQIERLKQRLPNSPIGTVDKFQGQQAPVVIYSMTTSTPADAPRGMEFLYSRHRLNVATSRARCACILVASPRLLAPECRAPHQMRLANALCRYVELARRGLIAKA